MDTAEKMKEALRMIEMAKVLISDGLKENASLRKQWGYSLSIVSSQLDSQSPLLNERDGFARVLQDVIEDEGKSWHKNTRVIQSENITEQIRMGRKLR